MPRTVNVLTEEQIRYCGESSTRYMKTQTIVF